MFLWNPSIASILDIGVCGTSAGLRGRNLRVSNVPHTPISRILAIEGFQRNTLFGVSPFFSNSSIDAYYAQNSDSLFNSETDTTLAVYAGAIQYGSGELSALTTDVLTNNGLYLLQWNGVNMPGSYNPANWGVLNAFDTEAFDDLYSDDVPELSSRANVSTAYDTGQPAYTSCLLYTSPSPRDRTRSRMPSSA